MKRISGKTRKDLQSTWGGDGVKGTSETMPTSTQPGVHYRAQTIPLLLVRETKPCMSLNTRGQTLLCSMEENVCFHTPFFWKV